MSINGVRKNAQQQFADGVEVHVSTLAPEGEGLGFELRVPVLTVDEVEDKGFFCEVTDLLASQSHDVTA